MNRKARRQFKFKNHHNIYTKKYKSARAYEKARIFFFGFDKKRIVEEAKKKAEAKLTQMVEA